MENTKELWQIEDAALKTTMQFFADELLPYFHIEGEVVGFGPTELVHLELQKLFQDFNLVMADGTWKHFEFQSTDNGIKDLKRFRSYEALTSYQHNVDVYTYVLYSGEIEHPITEFSSGFNTYCIQPIIMKGKRVEEVFDNINAKLKTGKPLTKSDLVPLTLCSLMSGEMSQKERIVQALTITRNARDIVPEAEKIEAAVYAMAEKFLDSVTTEQLKEAVGMTRLGQMMYQDGVEAGIAQGMERGAETAKITIAQNLVGLLADEFISEHVGLPLETVKALHNE
ncbi:MAG: hypothetical protein IJ419_00330 [Agathobacter sp.]|nr:hypothetical protein [Agathobacter sp.]